MRTIQQRFGEWDENEAPAFMAALGDEILARNVRTPRGDMDTVALSKDATIIVEGRAFPSDRISRPEETITRRKLPHRLAAVEDCTQWIGLDHRPIDTRFVEGSPSRKPLVAPFENGPGYFINPRKWDTF